MDSFDRRRGAIQRIGAAKGGYWAIKETNMPGRH